MRRIKRTAAMLAGIAAVALTFGGCSAIHENETAVTLDGGATVSMGLANFIAHYEQTTYDSFFASYYGDDYWTNEEYAQDGVTMEDSVKETVMESIQTQLLLEQHMKDYGVEITEDEKAAMAAAADQFMADNSDEAVRQMGASAEYVEKMLYYETVEQKMMQAIQDETDTNVSEEEAAQKTFRYMKIDYTSHTDDAGNVQTYTEEEQEGIRQTAQAAAAVAANDFDAAAETYSYEIQTYSYGADEESEENGGFDDAVIAAVEKMHEGEVSGLIDGDGSYYIVCLDSEYDPDATEKKKESIIYERKNAHYEEVVDGYREKASFEVNEDAWAKVKFDSLFTLHQEGAGAEPETE